jgi:hypothetical protein
VKMRLRISFPGVQNLYFLDLQIKSYGCLKFLREVWVGQACVRANEEELITCAKIWGQRGRKEGAGSSKRRTRAGAVADR